MFDVIWNSIIVSPFNGELLLLKPFQTLESLLLSVTQLKNKNLNSGRAFFSDVLWNKSKKKKKTLAHCIPLYSAEFMLCNYVYLQTPNYQLSSAGAATASEESQEVLELEERFCNEACVCEWKDKMLTKRDADTQTDILHALHIYETLRVIC